MTTINTNYIPDDPVFWGYFDIPLKLPDPIFGFLSDDDFIYVEMYHHNTDNENRLLQQLNSILSSDYEKKLEEAIFLRREVIENNKPIITGVQNDTK